MAAEARGAARSVTSVHGDGWSRVTPVPAAPQPERL